MNENDPFDLGDSQSILQETPSDDLFDEYARRLNQFNVIDKDSPLSDVAVDNPEKKEKPSAAADEALIDMMSQQMDSLLDEERERAEKADVVAKLNQQVQAETICRDDILRCESIYPGISSRVGGPSAFSTSHSKNGLVEFRRVVSKLVAETNNQTYLSTESHGDSDVNGNPLLTHFEKMVDKVKEAQCVYAAFTDEVKTIEEPLPFSDKSDYFNFTDAGYYLADVNLETISIPALLSVIPAKLEDGKDVFEELLTDIFNPDKKDIRKEIGLSDVISIRNLHAVHSNGGYDSYLEGLNTKLELLLTDILPSLKAQFELKPTERNFSSLAPLIDNIREYCRLGKICIRLSHQRSDFDRIVKKLVAWREEHVRLGL